MLSTAVIKPTPEQEAAVEAFVAKEDLKLLAVAGSGKTTTLKLMAEARPRGRFLYLVFNRALREEAERKRSFSPPGTSTPVNADGEARAGKIRRRSTARILRILPYRLNRIFTPITSALSFRYRKENGAPRETDATGRALKPATGGLEGPGSRSPGRKPRRTFPQSGEEGFGNAPSGGRRRSSTPRTASRGM